jgi:chemotaxis protein methyltransferase CheR
MQRIVEHAMDRMSCTTTEVLIQRVLEDPIVFISLLESLTVSVTEMFREPSYFLALKNQVFPHLQTYPSLKIWIPGCSTGEEALSLAILLEEANLLDRSTLYATDINPKSLKRARAGYLDREVIPKATEGYHKSGGRGQFLDYFDLRHGSAQVKGTLLDKITFADHNLASDSVFVEAQLVSCRNVLIYFTRGLQDQVIQLFSESLCRKGFLGLGVNETCDREFCKRHFQPFVLEQRIYQKI